MSQVHLFSVETLMNRISEGEGLFQEFKSSIVKLDRSIVAFANARGGVIFLGVDDQGGVIPGFRVTNRLKGQINDIARNIDPSISVSVVDLKRAAAVIVNEGANKPYRCADGFFMRIGATSQKLTRDEILDLALKVNCLRFESLQDLSFKYPADFSKDAFVDFLKRSQLKEVAASMGTEKFLISLSVVERQKGRLIFNHAGVLFFSENPQRWLSQAKISYARYAGKNKTSVIDRKLLLGTPVSQLEASMELLRFHVPVRYRFLDGGGRLEQSSYPLRALEEAITNAIIHRDYAEDGAEIQIDYYQDRIEITNPGKLVGSLSLESLGKKSLRRNPIVAELMYRMGKGEKLGSGISRMREFTREWQIPLPEFDLTDEFFSVKFLGPKPELPEEWLIKLPARPRLFMERRNLVNEPFSAADYAEMFQMTRRTAQKDLEVLLNAGLVQKEGASKNTRYRFRE